MANDFLHDGDGISDTITQLNTVFQEYSNNLSALDAKIAEIENSEDWIDKQVKSAYIATCQTFSEAFKKYLSGMEAYISALTEKTNNIEDFESTFSE